MDLRETWLENKRFQEKKDNKGAAEYFGANIAHLLNLVQMTDSKGLPQVWETLAPVLKHQKLLVLQRAFNTSAEYIGLHTLTSVTPYLLKLVLALRFSMESWDDLVTGLHPFVLGHHTSTVRKFLRGQSYQYTMVNSGAGAPSLSDVELLLAPDGVTLP